MSRIVKVRVSKESHQQLKEMAAAYQVSLSALAGSMIEEKLSDKNGFEEESRDRFENVIRRLGKMAHKLARTEILLDEFLMTYLFYTHEIPKDFEGRSALHLSAKSRHQDILRLVSERLKNKDEPITEREEEPKQV